MFSKLFKNEKFVHKTGRKMGLYGAENLLVPLPERKKKKVCFWLGAKKRFAQGKKP